MCGREPNFELSEEDKRELQGFQWDEFLELTRKSILNKSKVQSLQSFATVMLFVTVSFITILYTWHFLDLASFNLLVQKDNVQSERTEIKTEMFQQQWMNLKIPHCQCAYYNNSKFTLLETLWSWQ
jgi:hypothetical protein